MKNFRLQLAELEPGVQYVGIDFLVYGAAVGDGYTDSVLTATCGERIDYGHLFAYLFRRFGYPNFGWDDYKELAKYVLTTPHPGLVLSVVPYVGNDTNLHIRFHVPYPLYKKIEDWRSKPVAQWEKRAFSWQEQEGLPSWMDEWIAFCNRELPKFFKNIEAPFRGWRDTIPWMYVMGDSKPPHNVLYPQTKRAFAFKGNVLKTYSRVESRPACRRRLPDWRQWSESDPLRPLAEAAVIALKDLRRPVRVRDSAIDAYGNADDRYSKAVKEPACAGYACGELGNHAPLETVKLHQVVMKIGGGNAKRGIKKVITTIRHTNPNID